MPHSSGVRRSSLATRQSPTTSRALEQAEDRVVVADPDGERAPSGVPQVHAQVEDRHRVGQRADGDEVDARSRPPRGRASSVRPPEASSDARPAATRTASAIVGLSMLSSRIRSQPASSSTRSWSRSVTSTSTGTSGYAARTASKAAHDTAGRDHVVVLDHRHVGQSEAVVDAAAAAHGVLLQRPPPGQVLRVSSTRARVPARASTQAAVAVATPERCEAKLRAVRSAVSRPAGRPGHAHHHVARGHPGAVGQPAGDLDVVAQHLAEDHRGDPEPGDDPRPASPEVGDCPARPAGWSRRWSRRRRSPGRSSSSPARTWARTASGSRPAASSSARRSALTRRLRRRARPGGTSSTWSRRRAPCRGGPPSARRRGRGSPRASASRGSPRAARAASASARLSVTQVGRLPGVLVDGRCRVADERLERVQALRPGPSAERSTPARSVITACRSRRTPPATRPGLRVSAAGSVQGRSSPGSTSAMRRENTSPSSRELEASRLAPWTPEQATSPVA